MPALIWGAGLPLAILVLAVLVTPWALLLLLVYPLQVLRLSRRGGVVQAVFTVLGKFPEAQGALQYLLGRRKGRIIEYK